MQACLLDLRRSALLPCSDPFIVMTDNTIVIFARGWSAIWEMLGGGQLSCPITLGFRALFTYERMRDRGL
jgi:hypothetical protein